MMGDCLYFDLTMETSRKVFSTRCFRESTLRMASLEWERKRENYSHICSKQTISRMTNYFVFGILFLSSRSTKLIKFYRLHSGNMMRHSLSVSLFFAVCVRLYLNRITGFLVFNFHVLAFSLSLSTSPARILDYLSSVKVTSAKIKANRWWWWWWFMWAWILFFSSFSRVFFTDTPNLHPILSTLFCWFVLIDVCCEQTQLLFN